MSQVKQIMTRRQLEQHTCMALRAATWHQPKRKQDSAVFLVWFHDQLSKACWLLPSAMSVPANKLNWTWVVMSFSAVVNACTSMAAWYSKGCWDMNCEANAEARPHLQCIELTSHWNMWPIECPNLLTCQTAVARPVWHTPKGHCALRRTFQVLPAGPHRNVQFFFSGSLQPNPLRSLPLRTCLEDFTPKDWKLLKAERECSVSFNGPSWRSFLNLGRMCGKGPNSSGRVSTCETTVLFRFRSEHLADLHWQNSECCSLGDGWYLGKAWLTPPQVNRINKLSVSKSRWQVPVTLNGDSHSGLWASSI